MGPGCVLFDWGDTLMVDFREYSGPMAEWPRVEAVAHACEVLAALRDSGWRTALATNATDSDEPEIRAALDRVGLDDLVDVVYCSRRIGHAKPSPEFFAYVASHSGFSADELVMVGDSLTTDVEGANRAGIRAVLLKPGATVGDLGESSRVIGDLTELPSLLASWDGTDLARINLTRTRRAPT